MIHVYTDGASAGNPGSSGAGILFVYPNGEVEQLRYHLGFMSNHEAEFRALELALHIATKKRDSTIVHSNRFAACEQQR